jgi:H+/Cl- antiporter ClcA
MRKALTAVLAVATVAVSLATFATEASAGRRGGGLAAGLAIGAVGGLIAGAAIANSRPAYVVEPAPVVVAPRYCMVDQQIWSNRYQAWVVRPTRVPC